MIRSFDDHGPSSGQTMMNIHSAARHMHIAGPAVRSSGKLVPVSCMNGVDASGLLSAPHGITSAGGGICPGPTGL